ncbi:exostosin-2-like [Oppia nitens]|uniref:exostosin-2-like n=1 Tax=Oppia nitens TaxID=1686743 RepID=UPI0023DC4C9C|nr:exostosin-2-like [Oppia nitens]
MIISVCDWRRRVARIVSKYVNKLIVISLNVIFNWIPIYVNTLFTIIFICLLISTLYIILFSLQSLPSLPSLSDLSLAPKSSHRSLAEAKANVIRDYHLAVKHVLTDNQLQSSQPTTATNSKCNHYNCFDVYRCGNYDNTITSLKNEEFINVYIYPSINFVDTNHKSLLSPKSQEFTELLEAIVSSPYYTSDPSKACLLIPNIDLLNQMNVNLEVTSKILSSLPYWGKKGANHLIFNMISGSFPDYNKRIEVNLGDSLIAGAGFDTWTYRQEFDVSIPFYSLFSNQYRHKPYDENLLLNAKRQWLVVCTQYDWVSVGDQQILKDLEAKHTDQLLVLKHDCQQNGRINVTKMCNNYRDIEVNYPNILSQSVFCLILKTIFLGHPVLSDALMSGCIPVIISDEYVLPFETKIDWNRASIRVRSHLLADIMTILTSLPKQRIDEMRDQTTFLWMTYFSSMKVISLTTLRLINERIFPNSVTPADQWNRPIPFIYNKYAIISPKLASEQSHGFTAVILTYDRLDSLYEVIRSVVKAKSCVKVIVVWNNQMKKPPKLNQWPDIQVPLQIIPTEENKLSNRFYPYADIDTDAVLAIDDDIVMLTADELEFGYQTWREFPDRIVGFPSRVHRWDNLTHRWKYVSEWTNDVSMVLTGAAFYHNYYNHLYTNIMPKEIKLWVDQHMNCEDIAMNFLVSNVTGKAPIKVTPRKKFKCPECTNNEMLSADVLRHLNQRSDCINRFAAIYKSMPLKTVEFRADPVLYKDNLPERLKEFNSIGSL